MSILYPVHYVDIRIGGLHPSSHIIQYRALPLSSFPSLEKFLLKFSLFFILFMREKDIG